MCQGSKQTIFSGSLVFSFSLKVNSRLFAGYLVQSPPLMYAGVAAQCSEQAFALLGFMAGPCAMSAPLWMESAPEMEGAHPGKQEGRCCLGLFPMVHM